MEASLVVDAVWLGVANIALVTLLSRMTPRNRWLPLLLAGMALRVAWEPGPPPPDLAAEAEAAKNEYYQQKGCRMTLF